MSVSQSPPFFSYFFLIYLFFAHCSKSLASPGKTASFVEYWVLVQRRNKNFKTKSLLKLAGLQSSRNLTCSWQYTWLFPIMDISNWSLYQKNILLSHNPVSVRKRKENKQLCRLYYLTLQIIFSFFVNILNV